MRLLPTTDNILQSDHSATIAIASAAIVYTRSWLWGNSEYFGLNALASSSGVVGLKIELEESQVLPVTEGAVDANFAVAVNGQDVFTNLSVKTTKITRLSPVVSKYGRLKITGSGSNDASTTLLAKLVRQEEV